MSPKVCPRCSKYMNEYDEEYWCEWCDFAELKVVSINWRNLDD